VSRQWLGWLCTDTIDVSRIENRKDNDILIVHTCKYLEPLYAITNKCDDNYITIVGCVKSLITVESRMNLGSI
jgi:hypothetical protein